MPDHCAGNPPCFHSKMCLFLSKSYFEFFNAINMGAIIMIIGHKQLYIFESINLNYWPTDRTKHGKSQTIFEKISLDRTAFCMLIRSFARLSIDSRVFIDISGENKGSVFTLLEGRHPFLCIWQAAHFRFSPGNTCTHNAKMVWLVHSVCNPFWGQIQHLRILLSADELTM